MSADARPIVFVGPSLPLAEARDILDAIYLPPAGQGDLISAYTTYGPDAIGLIDGVFHQELSVWHKEILYVLSEGVDLYGSSSMGALRAAETAQLGMKGVGQVYEMYAEGRTEDDDEVALSYTEDDGVWRAVSHPMVNLRATFAAARDKGVIDDRTHTLLVDTAKSLYFPDRSLPAILQAAHPHLPGPNVVDDLREFFATEFVDVKKTDAIELLTTLRHRAPGRRPVTFDFKKTAHFDTLFNRDRHVRRRGVDIPIEEISNYAALNDPGFDTRNFHTLNRMLGVVLADLVGAEVDEDAIAEENSRFRAERSLEDDAALQIWLDENDMSEAALHDLMEEVALCRKLHHWFVIANWMARTSKDVLNEMRLDGVYPRIADTAAGQFELIESSAPVGTDPTVRLNDLVEEHEKWTGRRFPRPINRWAEEAGFHAPSNLSAALAQQSKARLALLTMLSTARSDATAAD